MFSPLRLLGRLSGIASPDNGKTSSLPKAEASVIGLIAGSGRFPFEFVKGAKEAGNRVVVVGHRGETMAELEKEVDSFTWIRVGELGKIITFFKREKVTHAVMAGGIDRVRLFGGVKLDGRGAKLLARLRSTKDDVIMRGIAEELLSEGIEIVSCTTFMKESMAPLGLMTRAAPSLEEEQDIRVGQEAIRAMSCQHIGQLVVVRDGVIVAVEAVEGTDRCISRGGSLGGKGTVVVKCAKTTQDMRFDVPTVGEKTIRSMIEARARVLALEAGRCLIIDRETVLDLANRHKISIIGYPPLAESDQETHIVQNPPSCSGAEVVEGKALSAANES